MEGSIHHDIHGYKVHLRDRWFRRIKIDEEWKSFKHNYQTAEDALILMNGDILRKKFDSRDWTSDEPLAFDTMAYQWLRSRQTEVRAYRLLVCDMGKAANYFGKRNIRHIRFNELNTFYQSLPKTLKTKTKRNIFATLKSFFQWIVDQEADRDNPIKMPKFPKIPYEKPDMPKILSPEDQAKVLGLLAQTAPFKVYMGALWCITYGLRWEEVRQVKMKDFNDGDMTVWDWKQKHYKNKKLLKGDWDLVKSEKAFGNEYFFRHESGKQYGKDYVYESIRKVLKELGFFGVKAYVVIRHSTVSLLAEHYSPEQVRKLWSEHKSDALYNHYWHPNDDKKQEIYARARGKLTLIEEKYETNKV